MRKLKISILVFFILLSLGLNAQSSGWRLAKGTEGKRIAAMDIYYTSPDTMYAIGDRFFLSTDNGETWDSLCVGRFYSASCNDTLCFPCTSSGILRIDPFNSKIIYVSHDGATESNDISMTINGGLTWKDLFLGQGIGSTAIEVDPMDKHTIYVLQPPDIIHRSSDNFKTWETIFPFNGYMTSLVIAPSNDSIIYCGYSSLSIIKTTDKGKSWFKLPFPITYYGAITLAVDPINADIIYAAVSGSIFKSVDGGINWNEINEGLSSNDLDIEVIFINPQNSSEIYIGTGSVQNKLLFKSKNAGLNWFEFNEGLPDSANITAITATKDKIYCSLISAGDSSGIFINDILTSTEHNNPASRTFILNQNYPNPFNNTTVIYYEIPVREFVKLTVYNIFGQVIKELINEFKQAGKYKVEFSAGSSGNAVNLPSGIYFYQLKTSTGNVVKKAVLIK